MSIWENDFGTWSDNVDTGNVNITVSSGMKVDSVIAKLGYWTQKQPPVDERLIRELKKMKITRSVISEQRCTIFY